MEPKTILCFGDSNTWGYNPSDGSRFPLSVRWTGRMQARLGADYRVIEEGFNGRTTVWTDVSEGKISGFTYLPACLESHAPLSLVILMLGTNDLKQKFNVNAANVGFALMRLIKVIRAAENERLPTPKILLISPMEITEDYRGTFMEDCFGEGCVEKSKQLSVALKKVAEVENCAFFDAAHVVKPSGLDGTHLSADGHEKLAAALVGEVWRLLEKE
ncbi:MAG: SGNH/GDSL hydrolase family protein [Clostridia bacterium]